MIKKIQVYNRFYMESLSRGFVKIPYDYWYLVSIYSFDGFPLLNEKSKETLSKLGCKGHISIQFDDITPTTYEEVKIRYPRMILFEERHAKEIVDFINLAQEDEKDSVLVTHCDAGISRSGAVAAFTRQYCAIDFEDEFIIPNKWVLQKLYERGNDSESSSTQLLCPVCSSKLRLFRMMYLRTMYWYAECEKNVSHYRWPSKWGCDSKEDLIRRHNEQYGYL